MLELKIKPSVKLFMGTNCTNEFIYIYAKIQSNVCMYEGFVMGNEVEKAKIYSTLLV